LDSECHLENMGKWPFEKPKVSGDALHQNKALCVISQVDNTNGCVRVFTEVS